MKKKSDCATVRFYGFENDFFLNENFGVEHIEPEDGNWMMNKMKPEFPNIFEYDNYRGFLQDAYEATKARDKKFSLRYFARVAGFKAHSFLSLVMQGKSNLSPDSIDKISKVFKMNSEQRRFFRNLVHSNQATTPEEKQFFSGEILKSRSERKIHQLDESQHQYFACWYYAVVRELVALPGFVEDENWIATHTLPHIKPEEARGAIEYLLKLGLLGRDENGNLIKKESIITTTADISSDLIASWHRDYLKRASESIDSTPPGRRDISSVSLCYSRENIQLIKEKIAEFRTEIVLLTLQEINRDALYQLNIQFFPISDVADKREPS